MKPLTFKVRKNQVNILTGQLALCRQDNVKAVPGRPKELKQLIRHPRQRIRLKYIQIHARLAWALINGTNFFHVTSSSSACCKAGPSCSRRQPCSESGK